MTQVTLEQIIQDISSYLRRLQSGESFILTVQNIPIAHLTPIPLGNFAQALQHFRTEVLTTDLNPDEIFTDVRDRSPAPLEAQW
ncbi:MAG: type II toxin-antitoxin system Phd/YefM family antitoxin [Microcoleaceae cyanobacterium]